MEGSFRVGGGGRGGPLKFIACALYSVAPGLSATNVPEGRCGLGDTPELGPFRFMNVYNFCQPECKQFLTFENCWAVCEAVGCSAVTVESIALSDSDDGFGLAPSSCTLHFSSNETCINAWQTTSPLGSLPSGNLCHIPFGGTLCKTEDFPDGYWHWEKPRYGNIQDSHCKASVPSGALSFHQVGSTWPPTHHGQWIRNCYTSGDDLEQPQHYSPGNALTTLSILMTQTETGTTATETRTRATEARTTTVTSTSLRGCADSFGSCNWYSDCLRVHEECPESESYALNYGQHFCDRYSEVLLSFSVSGQRWVAAVRICLQESLNAFLADSKETGATLACTDIEKAAFDSHPQCYVEPTAGSPSLSWCSLPLTDHVVIFETVFAGLLSSDGLMQALLTLSDCLRRFVRGSATIEVVTKFDEDMSDHVQTRIEKSVCSNNLRFLHLACWFTVTAKPAYRRLHGSNKTQSAWLFDIEYTIVDENGTTGIVSSIGNKVTEALSEALNATAYLVELSNLSILELPVSTAAIATATAPGSSETASTITGIATTTAQFTNPTTLPPDSSETSSATALSAGTVKYYTDIYFAVMLLVELIAAVML